MEGPFLKDGVMVGQKEEAGLVLMGVGYPPKGATFSAVQVQAQVQEQKQVQTQAQVQAQALMHDKPKDLTLSMGDRPPRFLLGFLNSPQCSKANPTL